MSINIPQLPKFTKPYENEYNIISNRLLLDIYLIINRISGYTIAYYLPETGDSTKIDGIESILYLGEERFKAILSKVEPRTIMPHQLVWVYANIIRATDPIVMDYVMKSAYIANLLYSRDGSRLDYDKFYSYVISKFKSCEGHCGCR